MVGLFHNLRNTLNLADFSHQQLQYINRLISSRHVYECGLNINPRVCWITHTHTKRDSGHRDVWEFMGIFRAWHQICVCSWSITGITSIWEGDEAQTAHLETSAHSAGDWKHTRPAVCRRGEFVQHLHTHILCMSCTLFGPFCFISVFLLICLPFLELQRYWR